jgi:hypothetical protein
MAEGDGRGRAAAWGAILGLVGGTLIVGGALLPWAQSDGVSVGTVVIPSDARGLEVSFGLVAMAAGILAAILALVTLLSPRRAARILGAALILVALLAGAVVVIHALDLGQTYVDFAITTAGGAGLPVEGVEPSINQLMEIGSLTVDPGLGLWAAGAGVVLVFVGGLLVLTGSPRPTKKTADMGFDSAR